MNIHSQQVNQYSRRNYKSESERNEMAKKTSQILKEINGDTEPTTGEKVAWFILAIVTLVVIGLSVL